MSRIDTIDNFSTPYERDRWEARYGDGPIKRDVSIGADFVQIGDEIFKVSDLEQAHIEHPQPNDHPIKPHHYCLQKDLDAVRAYFDKYPERRIMRLPNV